MAPELKARATAWIGKRRTEGRKVSALAVELWVAAGTILRWSDCGVRALIPVCVTFVSPSGFRIEGLMLDDASANPSWQPLGARTSAGTLQGRRAPLRRIRFRSGPCRRS